MSEVNTNNILIKNAIKGMLIGLIIPVSVLFIDFFIQDVPRSLKGFFYLYKLNPIHWFLLLVPLIGGVAVYFINKPLTSKLNKIHADTEKEQKKTKRIQKFTEKLINNQTDAEYEIEDDNDNLGRSLLNLRDYLNQNKENEKNRRKEDEQRHWIAEGLAKFGEILRRDNENMEKLSYNIISNLVNYLGANQGGFFIIEDQDENDIHFQLTGMYAYERKKYADKRVNWGEGLIGSAALERQTIYLTDVPDNYLHITSGLGKANPRSLLIVPLIVNEEIHGVIELAAFEAFEDYKIEFVEKVGESIASTISSVKINVRTAKLLEESREQAEVLASQEEQMRQNMEELQATQEEAARQAEKFVSFTNSVNHTLIRAEYDTDGTLLYANTKFLQKLGYSSNSEVEGQHISLFINEKDKDWFFEIWDKLARGGKHFEGDMKHVTKHGKDLWTMATYTCVRREDNTVEKILFLGIDTTENKKQSLDYEGQIKALNISSIKIDYDTMGNIVDYNDAFMDTLKYTMTDLKDKNVFDFIDENQMDNFKENWKNLWKGTPFHGQFITRTKYNEVKWLRSSYTPVPDMYGEFSKVVQISYEMTKEKMMEIETQKQTEQLKLQEEKLRASGKELSKRLEEARIEMKNQFQEIEKIKIRNERTLEGALDAIITIDNNGIVQFFNKAAEDLWGIKRMDILNKKVKDLFSDEIINSDEFINNYIDPSKEKIVGKRQEVKITAKNGEDVPVLMLLSDAKIGNEHWFTAFIQNIEVELF